jgi:N-acetylglucosamine-6-phosphate deacetylase
LWISWIADGIHIPFPALGNYLRCAGIHRSIIVTDATAAAGMGPGRYRLGSITIDTNEHQVARTAECDSQFAGSAVTMPQVIAGLQASLHLSEESLRQLVSTNPRRFLGICHPPAAP